MFSFERYKTVMETAITKMNEEIEKLRLERDQYKRRLEQKEISFTRGRRLTHSQQKKITTLEQELHGEVKMGKAAREEANRFQLQLNQAEKANRVATTELAKAKDRVAQMQAEHELEIAQLKRERDAMKDILSHPGNTTTVASPRTSGTAPQKPSSVRGGNRVAAAGRISAAEVSDLRAKVETLSSELSVCISSFAAIVPHHTLPTNFLLQLMWCHTGHEKELRNERGHQS